MRTRKSKTKKTKKTKKPKKGKKKLGRPKGSKNKKPKKTQKRKLTKSTKKIKKIKKIKKKELLGEDGKPYKPPRSYKMLGYCPKCKGMISTKDLISKYIYVCASCNKRARTNTIRKTQRSTQEKPKSKKEYIESTVNAEYHDMPPMEEVDPLSHNLKTDE